MLWSAHDSTTRLQISLLSERRPAQAVGGGVRNARFVWNRCLDLRSKAYETDKTRHNYVSLNRIVTEWKRGVPLAGGIRRVLPDPSADRSGQGIQELFEKRGRYPRFKSRHDRQAVRYTLDQRQIEAHLQSRGISQVAQAGRAQRCAGRKVPTGIPKMATVSKTPDGRYFVAFSCEVEIQSLPATGNAVGGPGHQDVVVDSDGWKSGNPRHLKRRLKHLKRQQRRLARMKGQQPAESATDQGCADSRQNRRQSRGFPTQDHHLHHPARRCHRHRGLARQGHGQNHHLAGAIADVGMGEFRRQLEYKAAWNGRELRIAGRFAPTSKTCSECQHVMDKMPLSVRQWTCQSAAQSTTAIPMRREIF